MQITMADMSLVPLLNELLKATDADDRSGRNLETVDRLFQRVTEDDSVSVNPDALKAATEILSVVQSWGEDDTTKETLQEYSAK